MRKLFFFFFASDLDGYGESLGRPWRCEEVKLSGGPTIGLQGESGVLLLGAFMPQWAKTKFPTQLGHLLLSKRPTKKKNLKEKPCHFCFPKKKGKLF